VRTYDSLRESPARTATATPRNNGNRKTSSKGKSHTERSRTEMADFHASTKPLSRSTGRSAVAAMSYRTGTVLVDERTGLVHDYTRRSGVEHYAAEVVVPRGCRTFTREALWNAAERAEQRKDARTAREWELALPCELSKDERIELVHRFAEELAKRYGTAVDYALHEPSSRGDQRNYHAHVMMTTRQVRNGALQEKALLEWNDKRLEAEGHDPGRKQIEQVRELWAKLCNKTLERLGREERVDHRSLKTQQAEALKEADELRTEGKEMEAQFAELNAMELERTPQTHVGWRATAMGRDGKAVDRTEMRLATQEEREKRRRLVAQLRQKIEQIWSQAKTAIQELIHPAAQPEAEKSAAAVEQKSVAEKELPEWLLQRFANKTVGQIEQEIERIRDRAGATPTGARELYEGQLLDPTSQFEARLKAAEAEVREIVTKWQKRRTEIEQWLTGDAVLKAHDKGWKKDKQLAALEDEHAEKKKIYEVRAATRQQAEQRWEQQRSAYEQQANGIRERIEQAQKELPVVEQHEQRLRDMALNYQEQQRERRRSKTKEREQGRDKGGKER
jgi:hypothetical protein